METSLLVSLVVSLLLCYATGQWPICGADFCTEGEEFCRPHKITGEDTCFRCDNFESMCFTNQHESNCTSWCRAAMMIRVRERDCSMKPPEISNGNYSLANLNTTSYQQDAKVEYTCSDGYYINGRKHVTCKEFGQWSDPPICEAVTCRMPKTPKNGQLYANSSQPVTEKKSLRYGETLSYTCDTGYHLIGETHSYCTGDGQLDHQPPVCIKRNSEKGLRILDFGLIAFIVVLLIIIIVLGYKQHKSSTPHEDKQSKEAEEGEALLKFSSGQFNSDTSKTEAEPPPSQPQSNGFVVGNGQPATSKLAETTTLKEVHNGQSSSENCLSTANNIPSPSFDFVKNRSASMDGTKTRSCTNNSIGGTINNNNNNNNNFSSSNGNGNIVNTNTNNNGNMQSNGNGIANNNNNNNNNNSANQTVNINVYTVTQGASQPFQADQASPEPEINGVGIQEEGDNAKIQPKSSDIQVPVQPLSPRQPSERFHPHTNDEGEKAIDNVNTALPLAGQKLSSLLSNHQQEQQQGVPKITTASGEVDHLDFGN